jgi:hypothetical protein
VTVLQLPMTHSSVERKQSAPAVERAPIV